MIDPEVIVKIRHLYSAEHWKIGTIALRALKKVKKASTRLTTCAPSRPQIRNEILSYRTFPADLFAGLPESIAYLRELVMSPESR